MKTSLVIMAAGIGSRFGGGIKQLEPVGMHGEIIMDYSIHDAIEAGFNKIIFIIRKDIEEAFREVIGERIEAICKQLNVEIDYAFQAIDDLPKGVKLPKVRPPREVKPLTVEEQKIMVDYWKKDLKWNNIFIFLLATGLRI